ncbi:MAG TPA: elongation factor G [Acholeplasmataceae bacterium]|jgi:elongation factor G|nr:elongation factor G [Acholeplasmataceae bacterium]
MKQYKSDHIQNIAILGHLNSGKTSLTEAMLFEAKAISKKGSVDKKNTVSDYLLEEQTRQTSLISSLLPLEWKDHKINFLDTPGSEEFIGDLENVLSVVEGAILLVDASSGVEVGTEACWNELRKRNIPTLIILTKMDKENVKFEEVLAEIKGQLSDNAIPFSLPLGKSANFDGYINVITKKARIFKDGKYQDGVAFDDKIDRVEELYEQLLEKVAESSEELLEKYFSGEELTPDDVRKGLLSGTKKGDVFPVGVISVENNVGINTLLDMVVKYLPSAGGREYQGFDQDGKEIVRKSLESEPFSAQIFKTTVDPFAGTISFMKVKSGVLKENSEVKVANLNEDIKISNIFSMRGNVQISVSEAPAGDIVCVAKVDELRNSMTLCDKRVFTKYPAVEHPTPILYMAIQPKNRQDEDKLSSSLNKLKLEDETFETVRNPETAQLLIGGQGTTHIGYILERMKNTYKVEVDTYDQKVVYRETIRAKGEAQGRHKKQSGGAGQFGDVFIRFEPTEEEFVFAEEIFGGAVPKNYFPAVEKGLRETFEKGPLAGFPVVGVKCTLYDGSYHPVDSNEISFRLAANLAWRNAVPNLRPTILEPIYRVDVTVKDDYVGDIMGDITKRRGRVLGLEQKEGFQVIMAEVPEAEITKYAIDLKAMTQGSGRFARTFLRYEAVPENLIDGIVKEYKAQ